jgi:hypothetical protein
MQVSRRDADWDAEGGGLQENTERMETSNHPPSLGSSRLHLVSSYARKLRRDKPARQDGATRRLTQMHTDLT